MFKFYNVPVKLHVKFPSTEIEIVYFNETHDRNSLDIRELDFREAAPMTNPGTIGMDSKRGNFLFYYYYYCRK